MQDGSTSANETFLCALHPAVTAEGACERCGSYACAECVALREDRTRWCRKCVLAYARPWSPGVIAVMSFLFGCASGGLLHVLNGRRFGEPGGIVTGLLPYLAAFFGLLVVATMLPEGPANLVGLGANVGFAVYFSKARKARFEAYKSAGGAPGSVWQAIGYSLLFLLALGVPSVLLILLLLPEG